MSKKFSLQVRVVSFILVLAPFLSIAQKNITGKIISAKDQTPVPGISVVIKGSKTGTVTATDGSFDIAAKAGDVLMFSGIGMKSNEVTIEDAKTNYIIAVEHDARAMNEVVVTALGI